MHSSEILRTCTAFLFLCLPRNELRLLLMAEPFECWLVLVYFGGGLNLGFRTTTNSSNLKSQVSPAGEWYLQEADASKVFSFVIL